MVCNLRSTNLCGRPVSLPLRKRRVLRWRSDVHIQRDANRITVHSRGDWRKCSKSLWLQNHEIHHSEELVSHETPDPAVVERQLTTLCASRSAPFVRSSSTVCISLDWHAKCSGVFPFCNRHQAQDYVPWRMTSVYATLISYDDILLIRVHT
jgi:hypothetical protein